MGKICNFLNNFNTDLLILSEFLCHFFVVFSRSQSFVVHVWLFEYYIDQMRLTRSGCDTRVQQSGSIIGGEEQLMIDGEQMRKKY